MVKADGDRWEGEPKRGSPAFCAMRPSVRWRIGDRLRLLLPVVFAVAGGCSGPSDGTVTVTVKQLSLSPSGRIDVEISYASGGPHATEVWLLGDTQNLRLSTGQAGGRDSGSTGGQSILALETADTSSVRFLVTEGEPFDLKPGTEKTLVEFAPKDPTGPGNGLSRVVIRVLPPGALPASPGGAATPASPPPAEAHR